MDDICPSNCTASCALLPPDAEGGKKKQVVVKQLVHVTVGPSPTSTSAPLKTVAPSIQNKPSPTRSQVDGSSKKQLGRQQSPSRKGDGVLTRGKLSQNETADDDAVRLLLRGPVDWAMLGAPCKTDLVGLMRERIIHNIRPDCSVRVGSQTYQCHRLLLQCYSEYFASLENQNEYVLDENMVTPEVFRQVYAWMLARCDECLYHLSREYTLELLRASRFLGIADLEAQVSMLISDPRIFHEESAFAMMIRAGQYGDDEVIQMMSTRIVHSFLPIVGSRLFVQLEPEAAIMLLSSDNVAVHSEMEIFMAAVRWLVWDWEKRKEATPLIMSQVRFGLMAPWQLITIRRDFSNEEYLKVLAVPEVQRMLDDGLAQAISRCFCCSPQNGVWVPRLPCPGELRGRTWLEDVKNYMSYAEFLRDVQTQSTASGIGA